MLGLGLVIDNHVWSVFAIADLRNSYLSDRGTEPIGGRSNFPGEKVKIKVNQNFNIAFFGNL